MCEYRVDPNKFFKAIAKMTDGQRSAYVLSSVVGMLNGDLDVDWAVKIHVERAKDRRGKHDGGYSDCFLEFWSHYPKNRKTGKGAAMAVWKKLGKEQEILELCLNALAWQKTSKPWRDGYIPLPETYLRQRRFDDDPPEEKTNGYVDMNGVWHDG